MKCYKNKFFHTTSYSSNESLFESPAFFFFEYYSIGYNKTIAEAKIQDKAGINIIVFFIKET